MPSFLDAEARLGGEFLHPGGQRATAYILDLLDLQPGQIVVDLGCGTGATAKAVIERSGVEVIAVDRSPRMLARAGRRLAKEIEQGRARLIQADLALPLPLDDESVDAVYAESVLALTDPAVPLRECYRVLRPGGRIATNDRIWKAGVSGEEAARINAISRQAFGIPAATPQPLGRDGWLDIFHQTGFVDVQVIPVDELPPVAPRRQKSAPRLTLLKRYARYAGHPRLLWNHMRFRREIDRNRPAWEQLESYIFFARKPG